MFLAPHYLNALYSAMFFSLCFKDILFVWVGIQSVTTSKPQTLGVLHGPLCEQMNDFISSPAACLLAALESALPSSPIKPFFSLSVQQFYYP